MPMLRAKPFLKWAGGKSQLLQKFDHRLPPEMKNGTIKKYIEPFVGGGAVFFYLAQKYAPQKCYLLDINDELVLAYRVVQKSVNDLIDGLQEIESKYYQCKQDDQKAFFYQVRENFNRTRKIGLGDMDHYRWVERAVQLVFLNRTCYNGLYRVNSRGEFNVPFGRYRNPRILDEKNLRGCARILAHTTIRCGDFSSCARFVDRGSFVYLDPPYRPLSETSSFTAYSEGNFTEEDQVRLARFYQKMDKKGAKLMLSNSDPKNADPSDDFFERLYPDFFIDRMSARRAISCTGTGRGELNELIITNYAVK
jgi:DNA adenine methylase